MLCERIDAFVTCSTLPGMVVQVVADEDTSGASARSRRRRGRRPAMLTDRLLSVTARDRA